MRTYSYDKLDQVRTGSTFDNFEVQNDSQRDAFQVLSGLADGIISNAAIIAEKAYPFPQAMLLFFHGKPGRGKTHLVEAFVNKVLLAAPPIRNKMVLSRGRFMYDYQTDDAPYGDANIVIIDDMYHDKQAVSDLNPHTDIRSFMNMITDLYDNHRLVIVTSNFPLLDGVMSVVRQVDKIGRIVSRAKEVMSNAGEIELAGNDFRETLLARRRTRRPILGLEQPK